MKKTILIILTTFTCIVLTAQVGINTTNPHASSALEITSKNDDKGLLIPRVALTALNVASPITASPATSLLVYNTATAGTAPNNVTPGYYYWDGTKWVRVTTSAEVINLYTADGNLTGNRSVTMGSNSLNFDANTLYIDPTADRVGVGTASPTEKLDVAGNVKFSGALMPNNLPGNTDEILKSSGTNTAPVWKKEWMDNTTSMLQKVVLGALSGVIDNPNGLNLGSISYPYNTEHVVKFPATDLTTNVNNDYDPTTGIYTVPSDGLYSFFAGMNFLQSSAGAFDGTKGTLRFYLTQDEVIFYECVSDYIYQGVAIAYGVQVLPKLIPLKAGTQIKLKFFFSAPSGFPTFRTAYSDAIYFTYLYYIITKWY